jgi:beta-glucosidase
MSSTAKAPKKRMSNKKFLWIWTPVIAVLTIVTIGANVAIGYFRGAVESALGMGTYRAQNTAEAEGWDADYYQADYDTKEEAMAASTGVITDIAAEGTTLLKNDGALPMAAGSVTLLGRGAADPIYGGTGSGHANASGAVTIRDSLEAAGFEVNGTVYDELSAFAEENSVDDGGRTRIAFLPGEDQSVYRVGEMPVADYTADALASLADYGDAAIVVIGRVGGEGGDLTRDMEGWDDNYEPGQHLLELNKDEKDQIALAKEHFDTVVVLINASTSMELGVLQDDPDIDSVLMVGTPGVTGFQALGPILTGEVNPSGRTVDLFSADFTADPTFVNFGNNAYTNTDDGYFVDYEEGIYSGYRYYETAAEESFIDYDTAVVYPFGYGLSYTTFDWQIADQRLGDVEGEISVDVTVTNTGERAGKDVVQLYYTAPYTPGGIEKSSVVLGDFAKTDLLEPGESQTVTVGLAVEDMASYDDVDARAYVLDAGEYQITVRTDSHDLKDGTAPIAYTVPETIVYDEQGRASDVTAATNQFDDVSAAFTDGTATLMSRADFAGTFPTAPEGDDLVADDATLAALEMYQADAGASDPDAETPTTGADGDVDLIDVRGLDYDDPMWDALLDQLTVDDMTTLFLTGAYSTAGLPEIGKPSTLDYDGPAGFSSFINTSIYGSAFPTNYLLGQTWNREIAAEMGTAIGNEALTMGISGWYAPAVNLHRSPFAGRNYEYFSEDPVLSGTLATQVVDGALTKGVYSYLKHFALNDQETNRDQNGLVTWADEQSIRELYLKSFEIVVKDASGEVPYLTADGEREVAEVGLGGIMSSFNRIGLTWAGGDAALQSSVLRDEWGFQGMVITDMAAVSPYMVADWQLAGGGDLHLSWANFKTLSDTESPTAVTNLRRAAHNVLYTVANSNAMNGIAPGATLVYERASWEWIQLVATVVLALLIAGAAVWVVVRVRRHGRRSGAGVAS